METIGKFIADVAGKLIGHKAQRELAQDGRNESRRKERLEIYKVVQLRLGDLFAEHGRYLAAHPVQQDQQAYSGIIEAARSEVNKLPMNDAVSDILQRLCPYFMEEKDNAEEYAKWGRWDTRNRDALDDAMKCVSQQIITVVKPE